VALKEGSCTWRVLATGLAGHPATRSTAATLSLRSLYSGSVETVERLLPSYPRHVARGIEELKQGLQWLRRLDQDGPMASATKTVLEEHCRRRLLSRSVTEAREPAPAPEPPAPIEGGEV
jgi:hypothetical protein